MQELRRDRAEGRTLSPRRCPPRAIAVVHLRNAGPLLGPSPTMARHTRTNCRPSIKRGTRRLMSPPSAWFTPMDPRGRSRDRHCDSGEFVSCESLYSAAVPRSCPSLGEFLGCRALTVTISGSWTNPGASGQSVTETIRGLTSLTRRTPSHWPPTTKLTSLARHRRPCRWSHTGPRSHRLCRPRRAAPHRHVLVGRWGQRGFAGNHLLPLHQWLLQSTNAVRALTSTSQCCNRPRDAHRLRDGHGQTSTSSTASTQASTSTCPPPPQPTVTISWGGSAPSGILWRCTRPLSTIGISVPISRTGTTAYERDNDPNHTGSYVHLV